MGIRWSFMNWNKNQGASHNQSILKAEPCLSTNNWFHRWPVKSMSTNNRAKWPKVWSIVQILVAILSIGIPILPAIANNIFSLQHSWSSPLILIQHWTLICFLRIRNKIRSPSKQFPKFGLIIAITPPWGKDVVAGYRVYQRHLIKHPQNFLWKKKRTLFMIMERLIWRSSWVSYTRPRATHILYHGGNTWNPYKKYETPNPNKAIKGAPIY